MYTFVYCQMAGVAAMLGGYGVAFMMVDNHFNLLHKQVGLGVVLLGVIQVCQLCQLARPSRTQSRGARALLSPAAIERISGAAAGSKEAPRRVEFVSQGPRVQCSRGGFRKYCSGESHVRLSRARWIVLRVRRASSWLTLRTCG